MNVGDVLKLDDYTSVLRLPGGFLIRTGTGWGNGGLHTIFLRKEDMIATEIYAFDSAYLQQEEKCN